MSCLSGLSFAVHLDQAWCCRLLAEYMQHSRSQTVAEAVEQLAGPLLLRMIHTQQGAYVGCCVFRHGTPRDRKKAIKAMKGALLLL